MNQLEDAASGHFVSTDNGAGTPTKSVACDSTTAPNNGLCAKKPTPSPPLEFLNSDLAFAQMDGPFGTVGGSEPAYGLAPGSTYYDEGIVMIRVRATRAAGALAPTARRRAAARLACSGLRCWRHSAGRHAAAAAGGPEARSRAC